MLRRRLVLSSSSDEEDLNTEPRTLSDGAPSSFLPRQNHNPTVLNRSSDQPLEISDDEEFIDVAENLSPPSPEPITTDDPPPPPRAVSPDGCPVSEFLRGLGLRLRRDWLNSCLLGLEQSVRGFRNLAAGAKAKLCFEKFLASDMNSSGAVVLPENVDRLHLVDLPGPFVLQVDEIVNISCPLKGRYQKVPHGVKRCLKLSLTDGVRRVFAMEYRPIKDLDVLAPAGLKVVICNVHIRHGLLMLVPEALEVLGGQVEELETARQRLVNEVNKPPRGIRSRNRVMAPLRERATLAAWTPHGNHVAEDPTNGTTSFQMPPQGASSTSHVAAGHNSNQMNEEGFPVIISEETVIRNSSSNATRMRVEELPRPIPNASMDVDIDSRQTDPNVTMGAEDDDDFQMYTVPDSTTNAVPNTFSDIGSVVAKTVVDTVASGIGNPVSDPSLNYVPNYEEMTNSISDPHLNNSLPNDDEILEVEHPLITSGLWEAPFTYMASLSAKWTSIKETTHSVRGTIKCFLTGVKAFQFRDQPTYELQAYVDDGSLICEILIHHDVVQKKIGYSPQEVSAALKSQDRTKANSMKDVMRKYQTFLVHFEGKMLVEMNRTSPLPVALEMNPGCSESDPRLLLRRVKSSVRAQSQPSASVDPIYLSP